MIIKNEIPSVEVLNSLLILDAENGLLWWKVRTVEMFTPSDKTAEHQCNVWNAKFAGKEAFTAVSSGYKFGRIFGNGYLAHRVIYKMAFDLDPDEIDHIDGNRKNNRISNLRNVDSQKNGMNKAILSNNTTGVCGVWFDKNRNKWVGEVSFKGKKESKRFDSFENAVEFRKTLESKYGFHENHGSVR